MQEDPQGEEGAADTMDRIDSDSDRLNAFSGTWNMPPSS
jgi:hypothetical protein